MSDEFTKEELDTIQMSLKIAQAKVAYGLGLDGYGWVDYRTKYMEGAREWLDKVTRTLSHVTRLTSASKDRSSPGELETTRSFHVCYTDAGTFEQRVCHTHFSTLEEAIKYAGEIERDGIATCSEVWSRAQYRSLFSGGDRGLRGNPNDDRQPT